jgi:hypothetical protein
LRLVLILLCPLAQWCCVLLLVGCLLVGACHRCVLCVCPEGVLTRPPAQGGSAGAVDTALATPRYGYAAYLRHFVISTYCALCAKHSPLRDESVLGLSTLSYRTRLGSRPPVRFLCVGQPRILSRLLPWGSRPTSAAPQSPLHIVGPPSPLILLTVWTCFLVFPRHAAEGLATTRHPVLNLSQSPLPIQVIGPIPHPPTTGKPLQAHHSPPLCAHRRNRGSVDSDHNNLGNPLGSWVDWF